MHIFSMIGEFGAWNCNECTRVDLKLCDIKFKFKVIVGRIQFWCIILAVSPTDKTSFGDIYMFSLTLHMFCVVVMIPGIRGHWVLQPQRIDQTQERLTLLLVLVDPQMFVRVSVIESLVHILRVEYLKSIKVIIINLQLLCHNEEVIYLNLN